MKKLRAGIIGATGMVGQRLVLLLQNHPYFEISCLAASKRSAGQRYSASMEGRWKMEKPIPENLLDMNVYDGEDVEAVAKMVDFVFCAVEMPKDETKALEERYAKAEIPVISNSSATRGMSDVPMLVPEINHHHTAVIETQRKRLGTKKGFISVKPNCSIQSYVPAITPLLKFEPEKINVVTFQAISGAGKTFKEMPEMIDNVIPFIKDEEGKSEIEPMKIWGTLANGLIVNAEKPVISAQCIRVPVTDGHLAAVSVTFKNKPKIQEILELWDKFEGEPQKLGLPNAPAKFITYMEEPNRPQTKIDRDIYGGMGVTVGRLREDTIFDYKFICLSHNTLRGAAGGGVLSAELLYKQGYLTE